MKRIIKSSVSINENQSRLFLELLKPYVDTKYDELPENIRSIVDVYQYSELIGLLTTNSMETEFSKLFVLVDYINSFTVGPLGSRDAQDIEDAVYEATKNALEDPDTAVIVLIDSHMTETYLNCNEGKFIPIPHANNEEERMIYGKVGELFEDYYDEDDEEYGSIPSKGVWFIYKSNWGILGSTRGIDYNASRAIDTIMQLHESMFTEDELTVNDDYDYKGNVYNTLNNLLVDAINMRFMPESITIAGVATNICVLSNAIILQSEYPEADMFIVENAIASYDKDLHKKAIDIMKGLRMKFI